MSGLDAIVVCRSAMGAQQRVRLADALDADAVERAHADANAWVKALRHARIDAASFRDRFHYRDDSLWWFAELYLHKVGRVTRWHAAVAAFSRLVAEHSPATIELASPSATLSRVGREIAARRGIGWKGAAQLAPAWRRTLSMRWRSHYLTTTAHASRLRPRRGPVPASPPAVAAFVHSAFWRQAHGQRDDGEEQYVGPVLREIERLAGRDRLALVGLGPRTNFRARRWWHAAVESGDLGRVVPVESFATRTDIEPSLAVWRDRHANASAMLASTDLRERSIVAGCDLWPLVADELEGVAWMQFPWSARAMDEAGAALDHLQPSAVLTYAEAGGWGRALVLEARRRGIPTAGLQHGFIYRHWLNYLHGADEFQPSAGNPRDPGFPAPTRTLVFDAFAARHLREAGHFPADRLQVIGSASQDALLARVAALRSTASGHGGDAAATSLASALGAAPADRLLLLVTKYTQVRCVFGDLVAAVSSMPGVRLVVKCHPAETAGPYERAAAGARGVTVAPATADLAGLLALCCGVVTVNSTVAVDAMRLGIPALVVDLPNNLSPFVDAGVMIGAASPAEIPAALRRLLGDQAARAELASRQKDFLDEFGGPADGKAAARAATAVLDLAGSLSGGARP